MNKKIPPVVREGKAVENVMARSPPGRGIGTGGSVLAVPIKGLGKPSSLQDESSKTTWNRLGSSAPGGWPFC